MNITPEIRSRLSKVYELVKGGATAGEKQAAQAAIDRLLIKYNISGIDLDSLDKEWRAFKYSTELEIELMARIIKVLMDDDGVIMKEAHRTNRGCREIRLKLTHMDYIKIEASYEYFRRHMKAQWQKTCAPAINRCRSQKTKAARRKELTGLFAPKYFIASGLFRQEEITQRQLSKKEMQLREKTRIDDVEGGQYRTQVSNGLYLN